jgi:SNF2 family DNA or RNA helicase
MRVGKTAQAILAAHETGAQKIVVVTRAIAVPQWRREIERWWPSGPAPKAKIYSYEGATAAWRDGLDDEPDVFIADESHFAKDPASMRTRMVYGKTGFAYRSGATWALSGTPAPKHAGELWPMLYAFGGTKMGYEEFMSRYCLFNWNTGRVAGTRSDTAAECKALLAPYILRRTRKEVAPEMPDIGFEFLEVNPIGCDYQVPEGMSDDALLEWLENNTAAQAETRQEVAMAKAKPLLEEILSCLSESQYSRTVVFGWHVEPLKWLAAELTKQGWKADTLMGSTSRGQRERIQHEFQSGQMPVICANILTAGTAIDLSAADHGYFLELDWVPGNNTQAANRLVSMGKDEPVTFDVVTWPGSVDDAVQRILLTRTRQLSKLY